MKDKIELKKYYSTKEFLENYPPVVTTGGMR